MASEYTRAMADEYGHDEYELACIENGECDPYAELYADDVSAVYVEFVGGAAIDVIALEQALRERGIDA